MPKGAKITIVEQHLEKGVLAICGLLLLLAISHWVFGSPRRVIVYRGDPAGEAPGNVDPTIEKAAQDTKTTIEERPLSGEQQRRYLEEMMGLQDEPFPLTWLADVAGIRPPTPRVDVAPPTRGGFVSLAAVEEEIPQPTAPTVVVTRELSRRASGGGEDEPVTAVVAHVVAEYPWAKLQSGWAGVLQDSVAPPRVVVAAVEIEGEVQSRDGTWAPRPVYVVSADGAGAPPTVAPFTGADATEVHATVDEIHKNWQQRLRRPGYWQVYDPKEGQWTSWRALLPASVRGADETSLVWFHEEGLQSGRPYRYRYRLTFVNPLLGWLADVDPKMPEDARQLFLYTDWSEWSAPDSAMASTTFFIRGTPLQGSVRVAVFVDALGQQVTENFVAEAGQIIGDVASVKITTPITGQEQVMPVDFGTGAIVVALDFDKAIFNGRLMRRAEEMIYLDAAGELHSRISDFDREHLDAHER